MKAIRGSRFYITKRGREMLRAQGATDAQIDMYERAQQRDMDRNPFPYISPVIGAHGRIGLVHYNGWKFDGRSAVRERVRICKGKRT